MTPSTQIPNASQAPHCRMVRNLSDPGGFLPARGPAPARTRSAPRRSTGQARATPFRGGSAATRATRVRVVVARLGWRDRRRELVDRAEQAANGGRRRAGGDRVARAATARATAAARRRVRRRRSVARGRAAGAAPGRARRRSARARVAARAPPRPPTRWRRPGRPVARSRACERRGPPGTRAALGARRGQAWPAARDPSSSRASVLSPAPPCTPTHQTPSRRARREGYARQARVRRRGDDARLRLKRRRRRRIGRRRGVDGRLLAARRSLRQLAKGWGPRRACVGAERRLLPLLSRPWSPMPLRHTVPYRTDRVGLSRKSRYW